MTHVVTDNCIQCKYTDCVAVCPVDCFLEGPNFLVIDPNECIDCTLCVSECPAGAIYESTSLPSNQVHFIEINRRISAAKTWPIISKKKDPLPDAKLWDGIENKLPHLKET